MTDHFAVDRVNTVDFLFVLVLVMAFGFWLFGFWLLAFGLPSTLEIGNNIHTDRP